MLSRVINYPSKKKTFLTRQTQLSAEAYTFAAMSNVITPVSWISKVPFNRGRLLMKAFLKAINVPTVPSSSCFFLFFLSCALDMTFPQHCVAPQGADQGVSGL